MKAARSSRMVPVRRWTWLGSMAKAYASGRVSKCPAVNGGLNVQDLERFGAVSTSDVDGVNLIDRRFRREMAVAAVEVFHVLKLEQQLAERRAAEIRFGEIPLG